jgi:hypothetical protein
MLKHGNVNRIAFGARNNLSDELSWYNRVAVSRPSSRVSLTRKCCSEFLVFKFSGDYMY